VSSPCPKFRRLTRLIQKHLRRKEYTSAADFAKDVELVFDNAHAFNNEGSDIWNDAQRLRTAFARLMADMPEPFALPQYSGGGGGSSSVGKIKLKRPVAPAVPAAGVLRECERLGHVRHQARERGAEALRIVPDVGALVIEGVCVVED
jgi:hypothetical protein